MNTRHLPVGTVVYQFDPEDAWDPDFPRCAFCDEELLRGQLVVDVGRRHAAHASCAKEQRTN